MPVRLHRTGPSVCGNTAMQTTQDQCWELALPGVLAWQTCTRADMTAYVYLVWGAHPC